MYSNLFIEKLKQSLLEDNKHLIKNMEEANAVVTIMKDVIIVNLPFYKPLKIS
jgi:hypothetical protein